MERRTGGRVIDGVCADGQKDELVLLFSVEYEEEG
jgi:hypothetical protein